MVEVRIMATITPKYRTKTFVECYPNKAAFVTETQSGEYFPKAITEASAGVLYYLLMAKYANNPIANEDENVFRIKLESIVFQFGGAWEKKLDIQKRLLELTDEDIEKGSTMVYNHAMNPDSAPVNDTLEALGYINDQNTSVSKKSKIDALGTLWGAIRTDVSKQFIDKFKVCFRMFVGYDYYEVTEDDGE